MSGATSGTSRGGAAARRRALLKRGGLGACALGVLIAGWWGWSTFSGKRGALDTDIAWYKEQLTRMENDLAQAGKQKKRLAELAGGGLGLTEGDVSASLRGVLNEIVQDCGLSATSVTTRDAEVMKNPATQGTTVATEFNTRGMKERIDFLVMGATVQGTGTLEQALRTLVTIQSQKWAHRVDSVSISPVGAGKERGSRVSISLRLTTVFVPDGGAQPVAGWERPSAAAMDRVAFVAARNAFREPTQPAVAAVPQAPPVVPKVEGQPYAEWRVTGLVKGISGPELWLMNERTRQTVMLGVGQGVMDAVFVGAKGEQARIKIGEQEYEVALSQTLQDRKVVSR